MTEVTDSDPIGATRTDDAPAPAQPGPEAGVSYTGAYRVSGKLGEEKTDALVITCSDRRFRRPIEHFLFKELGLGNYDLLAVPGGVYMLAFAEALPKQLKVGNQMVKFLVKGHMPPRIVLIAHQGCSRYAKNFTSWLTRRDFDIDEKQRHDLRAVRQSLSELFPGIPIDTYFATAESETTVRFDPA